MKKIKKLRVTNSLIERYFIKCGCEFPDDGNWGLGMHHDSTICFICNQPAQIKPKKDKECSECSTKHESKWQNFMGWRPSFDAYSDKTGDPLSKLVPEDVYRREYMGGNYMITSRQIADEAKRLWG